MYNGLHMTSSHVFALATLFSLLIPCTHAGNYQPLPGSFRPPSLGGTSQKQAGTKQRNSQVIAAPSQQQAWTSQPYGASPNYYLPTPQPAPQYQQPAPQYQQPAPQYQQQTAPGDTWGRSMNINPGSFMNNMFGPGNDNSYNQPALDYLPNTYQPPAFQQPYYYGSSYPLQYGHTPLPIQQPPATPATPSQPPQQPAPFAGSRPFGGEDMRFRPPELKGTD